MNYWTFQPEKQEVKINSPISSIATQNTVILICKLKIKFVCIIEQLKYDRFSLFKVFVASTIFNLQGKTKLRGVQQLKWFPGRKIPDSWFPLILRIKHWIGPYNNWAQYQNWVSWRLPGHYRLVAALYYKYVVSIEKCIPTKKTTKH